MDMMCLLRRAVLGSSSRILARSAPGAGRIVARLGTLPFHEDKVQLMSGAASRCPRRKKKKKQKLMRKREASWETHVVFGLRPGESDAVGKESALARWPRWPSWLAERVGD